MTNQQIITKEDIKRISKTLAVFNLIYPDKYIDDLRKRLSFLVSFLKQSDRTLFLDNLHYFSTYEEERN